MNLKEFRSVDAALDMAAKQAEQTVRKPVDLTAVNGVMAVTEVLLKKRIEELEAALHKIIDMADSAGVSFYEIDQIAKSALY